jgi:uncharacterized integral membrane protein
MPGATAQPEQPGPAEKGEAKGKRRSAGELTRTGVVLVLAVFVTLFAVLNLKQVQVDFVLGSGKAPLIIVIVIALLVGIVITHLGGRVARRKRG